MTDNWFRPKRFGFGATPVTWQGWLATAGMILLLVLLVRVAQHGHRAYLALALPVVLGFFWLTAMKTRGGLHWRWGDED